MRLALRGARELDDDVAIGDSNDVEPPPAAANKLVSRSRKLPATNITCLLVARGSGVRRSSAPQFARAEGGGLHRVSVHEDPLVQADHGGYPLSLGQVAWPIAARMKKVRVWAFDGGDPIGQWLAWAEQESSFHKRIVKRFMAPF